MWLLTVELTEVIITLEALCPKSPTTPVAPVNPATYTPVVPLVQTRSAVKSLSKTISVGSLVPAAFKLQV